YFPTRRSSDLRIIKDFKADVAVGVGGYASGPLLMMANMMGLPTLIQEQNSFAGKTNKSLGSKAKKICVAYEGMEQFFPAEKVLLTGNPIRRTSVDIEGKKGEALVSFGLDRKSTRLNSSHVKISYAVFCLKKKKRL